MPMPTWIPKAFACDIRSIYDFNPDETRIQVVKVFLSKQSQRTTAMNNNVATSIVICYSQGKNRESYHKYLSQKP